MLIIKFGGRVLVTRKQIQQVGEVIRQRLHRKPIVVLSALGGITDELIKSAQYAERTGKIRLNYIIKRHHTLIKQLGLKNDLVDPLLNQLRNALKDISLLRRLTSRLMDYVLSFGERFSTRIVAAYLDQQGIPALALDAFNIGLITDSNFRNATPLPKSARLIRKHLKSIRKVPVITGFIGKNKLNQITTMGRDGSDYTASFIGAALDVEEIQIWRDIPGILTADPAMVKKARLVKHITLEEASELVHYGNGVLHPYMLKPAVEKQIPIRILNIFEPASSGTSITNKYRKGKPVKAVAYKKGLCLVNIVSFQHLQHSNFVSRVFNILEHYWVFVHLAAYSATSISFFTSKINPELQNALAEITSFAEISLSAEKSIVCVIGGGLRKNSRVVSNVFNTLQRTGLEAEAISHDALQANVAFMVPAKNTHKAIQVLHRSFFDR